MANWNTTGTGGIQDPDRRQLKSGEVGDRALEQEGRSGEDSVTEPSDGGSDRANQVWFNCAVILKKNIGKKQSDSLKSGGGYGVFTPLCERRVFYSHSNAQ